MVTSTRRTENPLGLTPAIATAETAGLAQASATPTAPPQRRKRRPYTPRARRCQVCGQSFKPKNKTAKTCSTACRSKLYRRRHAGEKKPAPPRPLMAATCDHCRRGFLTANPLQRHCSASCRTLASRARRNGAIALLIYAGYAPEDAADAVDLHGLTTISAQFAAVGYTYDPAQRAYRPVAPPPTNGNTQNARSAV